MRKEDQTRVLSEVRKRVVARHRERSTALASILEQSLESERERLATAPLSVRTLVDRAFWFGIGLRLRIGGETPAQDAVWAVVSHYAEEICGDFDPVAYEVALRVLPPALRVLLSASALSSVPNKIVNDEHERIVLEGELERVKRLHESCTLIFTPTHHSNLDSIVLGLALHRLGVPPLIYGAGINLLGNPVMGLFMHNFGAYTVDRQKTDPLYRDTLKEYVVVTLEDGYHHLFYPGGTRSRNGALEDKLKLGLLGASVDAQRNLIDREDQRRILIVPVTLSYELVPEAESLIRRDPEAKAGFAEFAQRLLSLDSRIHVVFGSPFDVAGNPTDDRGLPIDAAGRALTQEQQRTELEADPREVTRRLGEAIKRQFRRDNLLQATHVGAYALRASLESEANAVPRDQLERALEALLSQLRLLERQGQLKLSPALRDAHSVLLAADTAFSSYHARRALAVEAATVHTQDRDLLDFYANRLSGYGL